MIVDSMLYDCATKTRNFSSQSYHASTQPPERRPAMRLQGASQIFVRMWEAQSWIVVPGESQRGTLLLQRPWYVYLRCR